MPVQQINQKFDDIELIRKRLRNAQGGRKKIDSIASLVEILREDIEAQRARGLTWRTIALAISQDETKQAAIRSAYQRLPKEPPGQTAGTRLRKTRRKSAPPSPDQETPAEERPATPHSFSFTPFVDTYGSDDNN
ncbi:hypothetical protein QPK87_24430 [Kamptonema cortianum]|nr:hypothetical protein [Kamptonema cortianum]